MGLANRRQDAALRQLWQLFVLPHFAQQADPTLTRYFGGAGIWTMSRICSGPRGAATNLFFTTSASTRSRPLISSGDIVLLGKNSSRHFCICRAGTWENSSYSVSAFGSEYIQSSVSR